MASTAGTVDFPSYPFIQAFMLIEYASLIGQSLKHLLSITLIQPPPFEEVQNTSANTWPKNCKSLHLSMNIILAVQSWCQFLCCAVDN